MNHRSNSRWMRSISVGKRRVCARLLDHFQKHRIIPNPDGMVTNPTLLNAAAAYGCLRFVKNVLKDGADVNKLRKSICGRRMTLLHVAVINNHVEMAKLLLSYGANVNVKNSDGITPLVCAIENRESEMMNLLLNNGAYKKDYPFLLRTAVTNGNLKIVQDLLEYGADVNTLSKSTYCVVRVSPIVDAIKNRDNAMIELLLTNGADLRKDPKIICAAAWYGFVNIVEDLLKDGADVNTLRRISHGYHVTLLHIAVVKNQIEIAELLINYGADVNVKNSQGTTILTCAIGKGDVQMIKLLLMNGAYIEDECAKILHAISPITMLLKQHIVMMKAAGFHVSEKNVLLTSNEYEMNYFRGECEQEIKSMKTEKIYNSSTSFYDILTKNKCELTRNECIVQALKLDEYKTKFPIYAGIIDSRFRRLVKREELLEQVRNKCSLFESLKLPLLCTEKICSYLSHIDLRSVLVASKISNKSIYTYIM